MVQKWTRSVATAEDSDDEECYCTTLGRTAGDRFYQPKDVHYAGSDAAEDEDPITSRSWSELYRYSERS